MKNFKTVFFFLLSGCLITACNKYENNGLTASTYNTGYSGIMQNAHAIVWDFDEHMDPGEWFYANNMNLGLAKITDGSLVLSIRDKNAVTAVNNRTKVRANPIYGYTAGRYVWRVYIPDIKIRERCSIGAWLYHERPDETFRELDFEVCSGKLKDRNKYQTADDEVLAFMTAHSNYDDHDYQQIVKIKKNAWHIFEIDLSLVNNKYLAKWIINGTEYGSYQLDCGIERAFSLSASVEELEFTGNLRPTVGYSALYDYVSFTPYE